MKQIINKQQEYVNIYIVKEKWCCAYGFANVMEETVYLVHFAYRIRGKKATFNVKK